MMSGNTPRHPPFPKWANTGTGQPGTAWQGEGKEGLGAPWQPGLAWKRTGKLGMARVPLHVCVDAMQVSPLRDQVVS